MATRPRRSRVDDLRGASRLAVDATRGVTEIVEAMHRTIGGGPAILGRPLEGPARMLTAPIYGGIRAMTMLVGSSIDVALSQLAAVLGESAQRPEHEAVVAALNGVLGDYLAETNNPLAIEMSLRTNGEPLELTAEALRRAFPEAGSKLLVLVHGSSMNDLEWKRAGHDIGALLARDLGFTPLYLHYNSGLHVSTNGRAFAAVLERLASAWPATDAELTIVAHSMGGLVARSACHYAESAGHAWRRKLRNLVCLGTPHHGAPLERTGNLADVLLLVSRYSAPLARLGHIRSAGVTDMRFGSVLDDDWRDAGRFERRADSRRPVPLPSGVECYAIAATKTPEPRDVLASDGLVPVDSAFGTSKNEALTLAFPADHRFIAFGANHLDLLVRDDVYEKIREWLARGPSPA